VRDEGLSIDVNQRFGDRLGEWLEPSRQATREYRDRTLGAHDWAMTSVPSKSNRKPTSCSLDSRMAARSRIPSLA
jgi:hypothetical protein